MTGQLVSESVADVDDTSAQAVLPCRSATSDIEPSHVPSLPDFLLSPEEIALRAAEIRSEWTIQQRARNRADPVKADVTDRLDGFQWPAEGDELLDGDDWADINENN